MQDKIQRQIEPILARSIQTAIQNQHISYEELQEIRLRLGQPVCLIRDGGEQFLMNPDGSYVMMDESSMSETVSYMSHYSFYAYEEEMKQGFLTMEGGHRIGIAGKVILEGCQIKNIRYISSLNIRIAHQITGCAMGVLPYITNQMKIYHTLIISPPRCGKTTLLRDLIRLISDGNDWVRGCSVGVVDERSELGACYQGKAQNELGMRTDILDHCPKAEGMLMLIRSMAPQVIAVDEIGSPGELHAVEYAMHCGCKMLATVHGASMEELRHRPVFQNLIQKKRFDRYLFLGDMPHIGSVVSIFDARGNQVGIP